MPASCNITLCRPLVRPANRSRSVSGVTMPAIMILGFDLEITRVMLVSVLGGLLGILMMIPLRRAMIVDQHGLLKYPEGTACAEVLESRSDVRNRWRSLTRPTPRPTQRL